MIKMASLPANQSRTVSTTNVLILPHRRCGNTTRIVDKVIQDLFAGKLCRVVDHHPTKDMARRTFKIITERLFVEHHHVYEEGLRINEEMSCMWLDFTHLDKPKG